MSNYKIATKCIHSGYTPKNGEPRQIPICQSTTYKYDSSVEMGKLFDLEASGYFYTRLQNPTNDCVAARIVATAEKFASSITLRLAGNAWKTSTARRLCIKLLQIADIIIAPIITIAK